MKFGCQAKQVPRLLQVAKEIGVDVVGVRCVQFFTSGMFILILNVSKIYSTVVLVVEKVRLLSVCWRNCVTLK
jgi:hypothetical protein